MQKEGVAKFKNWASIIISINNSIKVADSVAPPPPQTPYVNNIGGGGGF
jgi:hypothetical protein